MGERDGSSFWQYLQLQTERDDAIGILARAVLDDPDFPRLTTRIGTLVQYVHAHHSDVAVGAEQALRNAHDEWQEWRKH